MSLLFMGIAIGLLGSLFIYHGLGVYLFGLDHGYPTFLTRRIKPTPQAKAKALYKKELAQNSTGVFPFIYRLFKKSEDTKPILSALMKISEGKQQKDLAQIFKVYLGLVTSRDLSHILSEAREILAQNKRFIWGKEIASLYTFLHETSSVSSLAEIILLDFNPIREFIQLSPPNSPLFPSFQLVAEMEKIIEILSRFEAASSSEDRLVHLITATNFLGGNIEYTKRSLYSPERSVFLWLFSRWHTIITQEIKELRGKAKRV
ncbi:MAG: hypothetical protein AB1797_11930 [bacterium]